MVYLQRGQAVGHCSSLSSQLRPLQQLFMTRTSIARWGHRRLTCREKRFPVTGMFERKNRPGGPGLHLAELEIYGPEAAIPEPPTRLLQAVPRSPGVGDTMWARGQGGVDGKPPGRAAAGRLRSTSIYPAR